MAMKDCLVPVLACVLLATPASGQTKGICSDEHVAEARSSPIVLHFDPEQSALRNEDEKKLQQLARLARSNQIQEICVQSFSDPHGNPALNEELSLSRGQAVASALSRHGVDPQRIVIDPNGEPGSSIAGFLNQVTGSDRRVEVRISRY